MYYPSPKAMAVVMLVVSVTLDTILKSTIDAESFLIVCLWFGVLTLTYIQLFVNTCIERRLNILAKTDPKGFYMAHGPLVLAVGYRLLYVLPGLLCLTFSLVHHTQSDNTLFQQIMPCTAVLSILAGIVNIQTTAFNMKPEDAQ